MMNPGDFLFIKWEKRSITLPSKNVLVERATSDIGLRIVLRGM
jgi:hypothetical protein